MLQRRKAPKTPRRLTKKAALFDILSKNPSISAGELQRQAQSLNVEVSLVGAYRAIRAFKSSDGKLELSENNNLKTVSAILSNAAQSEHLSVAEIRKRAADAGVAVHESTIYRTLAKLSTLGLVSSIEHRGQKLFEWNHDSHQHGHLTCEKCGRTIEFQHEALEDMAKSFCVRNGFEFLRMEFLLRSICRSCKDG